MAAIIAFLRDIGPFGIVVAAGYLLYIGKIHTDREFQQQKELAAQRLQEYQTQTELRIKEYEAHFTQRLQETQTERNIWREMALTNSDIAGSIGKLLPDLRGKQ